MTLLKFSDVSLAFGAMPLLDRVLADRPGRGVISAATAWQASMMELVRETRSLRRLGWRARSEIGECPEYRGRRADVFEL